ncbi:MAG: polysaccharide biosynthesis protein [Candidatus Latescibacterota bacterium]|nr:MAG: polysaccharide biosynthesis protein [Candidatus Latescibacterota bacterium]
MPAKRVLLAGAGTAGRMAVEAVRKHPEAELLPVGFLDDDPDLQGREVAGLPVLGPLLHLVDCVQAHDIDEVLIAIPTAQGPLIRQLVSLCARARVPSRIVPGVMEIIRGDVHFEHIRPVRPEDLLGREVVELVEEPIEGVLRDRCVLVTGAGGSIGAELCRQIARFDPRRLLLLGRGENSIFEIESELRDLQPQLEAEPIIADIRDAERVRRIFERARPDVVFHAAAHKHVPYMERHPSEAILNNVWGTLQVVRAAQATGAERVVFISTDKAVRPRSVMGASKRFAEHMLQASQTGATRLMAVRFGNVLASRGSVVNLFQAQLRRGVPLTVTHPDATRYFMTVREACMLVLQASALGAGGEVYTLAMGEAVKIGELARDLVALSGFEPDDVAIRYTGMRPGEKLHEELRSCDDSELPSPHPHIFVARIGELQAADAIAVAEELTTLALHGEDAAIQRRLAELLPEYTPTAER